MSSNSNQPGQNHPSLPNSKFEMDMIYIGYRFYMLADNMINFWVRSTMECADIMKLYMNSMKEVQYSAWSDYKHINNEQKEQQSTLASAATSTMKETARVFGWPYL